MTRNKITGTVKIEQHHSSGVPVTSQYTFVDRGIFRFYSPDWRHCHVRIMRLDANSVWFKVYSRSRNQWLYMDILHPGMATTRVVGRVSITVAVDWDK